MANLKYLGVIIDNRNERNGEIVNRIQKVHMTYYKYKNIMRSKTISRGTKIRVYGVVTYRAETMNLTKREKLWLFEKKKIVIRIYGPEKVAEVEYRRLMNAEIQKVLRGEDIVNNLKIQRLRWYGDIRRMKDNREVKRITMWKPNFKTSRGRPRL